MICKEYLKLKVKYYSLV